MRTINSALSHRFDTWTLGVIGLLVVSLSVGCSSGSKKDAAKKDAQPKSAKDGGSKAPKSTSTGSKDGKTEVSKQVKKQAGDKDNSKRVLRHAVFFKFKDASSKEDVKEVVDAFRGLPAKIDTIIDFEWGENNSPEERNDGLTHCFLLTFKDEAGRAVYLPHAEHSAFGDVLRPHMEKVFVIDYWGVPREPIEKALKHAVFLKFKDDAKPEDVEKVEKAFAALSWKMKEIAAFEWGKNNSPERHHNGFTHCFMVTFANEADRAAYLPHPEHKNFVKILQPVLDKVRVLDYFAQPKL